MNKTKLSDSETGLIRFEASRSSGQVSAILQRPQNARCLLVLGHGAGAGMRHAFMQGLAAELEKQGIATLRYQFAYMEKGKKSPDPQPILLKTVRAAVAKAAEIADGLPLIAGGKSLGGRMTSSAAAKEALPGVHGLVFFGFPLHAPGRPGAERGEHLLELNLPMLFLQGTRDKLAELNLLRPLCERLGKRATLHIIEGADHGFHVPKKSGKTDEEVLRELAATTADWVGRLPGIPA